ncbi:MAG TPA: hypothetical protein VIF88_03935 [Methylocystis sp.]|jgi:hypothetical protein
MSDDNSDLRERVWEAIPFHSISFSNPNVAEAVDRIFDDVANVIRQRTGWSLSDIELLLADAKNRANAALDQAEEADDRLVEVDDAVDAVVEMLTEEAEES